jgi:hypothetical protein
MTDKNALLVEEQALHEQELALVEMEAQVHNQEHGVAQMERAFLKKNRALLNLSSYVADQESSLLARARAMGDKAVRLVSEVLAKADMASDDIDLDLGRATERHEMLHRRRELLSLRSALIEEREALYAARAESLERAESQVSELEQRLVRRESAVSEAARAVFSSSSALLDEDDDEGEPVHTPKLAHVGPKPGLTKAPKPIESSIQRVRTSEGRARVRTNQFKITLEAQLGGSEPHHFFRYEADGPEDLPGFFVSTPNLLKEGREVRVKIGLRSEQLEVTGIVAWRRQRGQPGGGPGMGVELIGLSPAELELLGRWTTEHLPVVI